ncbi:tetratricopeptide repeat protein [Jannaschia seosinensis]|uniref:Tetratricopeptide repeat protein n=1 Tax=Jannaschia seosinensis TaxID=313367 RepID=A0A0M7B6F9_9RHOB|nr:heme biosynthesis HemY N-terminal domain-containing protein [Jannaschia seosinensis]CUH09311.1 tetratricopeptide repeat protein [Jannaschia seosinensis]
MLWSLFKILVFVAVVIALAYGVLWLLAVSGEVLITFNGAEYVLPPIMVILGVLALMLALWVVFKLAGLLIATLRFINGDDTALGAYFDRNRERKGYDALSDSLIALASGEAREAAVKAQRAEKYLKRPEVTTLVVAQASEAAGDTDRAREAWKELVRHDRTRFVGVRGLMRQKLEAGDTDTALKLAEKAFALKPRHVETQDTLLRLQASDENWDGARRVLTAKLKSGSLPKDVYKRREAVLTLADARDKLSKGEMDKARAEAFEANRLSPELVPAAVLAARMHIEGGDKRRAAKVLRTAQAKTPHPDLAAAFAGIEPGETPEARIKRFQPFLKVAADAPETRMLDAELHLAAEDFPGARRALGRTYETHPTSRALTLMAAIERGEGANEAVVRGWLTKALSASRGPQWVCTNCGTVHSDWLPVCTRCEAFDSLAWTEPAGRTEAAGALGSDMLPLLVGGTAGAAASTGEQSALNAPREEAEIVTPIAPEAAPAPTRTQDGRLDPTVVGTTDDVGHTVTMPAGESPPAPQDETPTTSGTSRM